MAGKRYNYWQWQLPWKKGFPGYFGDISMCMTTLLSCYLPSLHRPCAYFFVCCLLKL